MRLWTLILWSLGLFLLGGCTLLFDDTVGQTKTECEEDDQCLTGEYCDSSGRCISSPRPMPPQQPDQPRVEPTRDAVPPPDMEPPEPEADMADSQSDPDCCVPTLLDEGIDLGPDATFEPPYPNGECFAELDGELADYETTRGASHVPYAFCSQYGLVWTASKAPDEDDLDTGWVHVKPAPPGGLTPPYSYLEGTTPIMFGPRLFMARANPDASGATNLFWVDLTTGESGWFRPGGTYTHRRPVVGADFLAVIEDSGGGVGKLVFLREDDRIQVCPYDGATRFGLGAAAGSLAWFERPTGARRDRIVVTRGLDGTRCPDVTRTRFLPGAADVQVGIQLTEEFAYWIQRDPAAAQNGVYRWAYTEPLAQSIEPFWVAEADSGTPVDLVAADGVLAIVRFNAREERRYRFEFIPPIVGRNVGQRLGDVRRPSILGPYLMWAEYQRNPAWEVRYARIRDR